MVDKTNAIVPFPTRIRQELEFRRADLEEVLPDWIGYKRFVNMSLMAVTRTPKLAECDFSSVYLSLLECARLGLYPDGRQAAIVPYKGRAQLLPMIQGITELMLRAPGIVNVDSKVVYDGDEFDWSETPSWIKHKPSLDPMRSQGNITHAYALLWRKGIPEPIHEVIDRAELDKARETSAANSQPAWDNWPGEQSKKVATKRISKKADMTPEAQRLINWDNDIYGDPTIDESFDGPSEHYQNMSVKIRTEEGLDRLKNKIEDENEPPPEPEPEVIEETEGEGEVEKARTNVKRSYPVYMIKILIDQELADHENHAVNILNLFPDLALNTSGANVVDLVKIYRQRRKELGEIEAAEVAWSEWKDN